MLVLDFATIYGNDWYTIPVPLPIGTLTAIRSLVVGDTFGGQWLIGPAAEPGWVMYQLTAEGPDAAAVSSRLDRLLLPQPWPPAWKANPWKMSCCCATSTRTSPGPSSTR